LILLIDGKINGKYLEYFNINNYKMIFIPENKNLQKPINSHTDMNCCKINETIFCDENIYDLIKNINYNIIKGESKLQKNYPFDIAYNAAFVGKFLFCNKKYAEPKILEYAEKYNISIIDVKQGYTKCSMIVLNKNNIITSDIGIYNKCKNLKINSLFVTNKNVKLNGYNNGFICGCAFVTDNELIFTGDITKHNDYFKIIEFCDNINFKIKFIENCDLYDFGSPIIL